MYNVKMFRDKKPKAASLLLAGINPDHGDLLSSTSPGPRLTFSHSHVNSAVTRGDAEWSRVFGAFCCVLAHAFSLWFCKWKAQWLYTTSRCSHIYSSVFGFYFEKKNNNFSRGDSPWQIVPGWQSSQDVNLFSGHRQLLSLVNTKFWPIHCRAPSLQTSSTILRFPRSVAHSCREVLKEDNTQKRTELKWGFINRWSISNLLNTEIDINLRALIRHFTDTLVLSQSLP